MGCCNIVSLDHEVLHEENIQVSEKTPNMSFADLSIRSKEPEDQCGLVINTEELFSSKQCRLRSTSCNSLRYSNHIENAFLLHSKLN